MAERSEGRRDPGPTDPDQGLWRGRRVARRFVSPDGLVVLVGRNAEDNDVLSLKLASPRDFWLHVATGPGSHVVVRNPDGLRRLPRESLRFAAGLAAAHSSAKAGGRVAVHLTFAGDVGKSRGLAPGKVEIGRYETVTASPLHLPPAEGGPEPQPAPGGRPPRPGRRGRES
ncbi:MAG: NFACT RNA binding domain-containing protein [Alphaproteobacteria bacterium]